MGRYISIYYDLFPKVHLFIARGNERRQYNSPTPASLARVVRVMTGRRTEITVMSNYVNLWQSHDKEAR